MLPFCAFVDDISPRFRFAWRLFCECQQLSILRLYGGFFDGRGERAGVLPTQTGYLLLSEELQQYGSAWLRKLLWGALFTR